MDEGTGTGDARRGATADGDGAHHGDAYHEGMDDRAADSGGSAGPEAGGGGTAQGAGARSGRPSWVRRLLSRGVRFTSLRLRLVLVFGLVALTAAVSASGIAYWLNREAVLTRAQDNALGDFKEQMGSRDRTLPLRPTQEELRRTAYEMSRSSQHYDVVLIAEGSDARTVMGYSDPDAFTLRDVPSSLLEAVNRKQKVTSGNKAEFHMFWQRVEEQGTPYLVGGVKVVGGGPTGYLRKSLQPEADDLRSLAWSLGIATGLALIGSALLAQAAATTVLKPVHRLGVAARRLGEGKLNTRLQVSGTDELAELSRTFNRTAASLEKRVADMSAREESSRRFVADMSHELRTPLTAITAVSEVLEEEADSLDPMIQPAVRLVVSETRRLNSLVENLMEVTRFDAGTARLVLDDVDIADQITACIDARAWLDAVDLDAERGIMARLDPRRLDVILANLIGNALKHGGSPVRVSVRVEGEDLVIRVRDHGPGIPEEVLPHVFDRFYKASASRPRSDGSGLGLSIAMENARIHGGRITAHNASEGGAVFTLRLPLDGRTGEDEEENEDGGGDGGRAGDGGAKREGRPARGGGARAGDGKGDEDDEGGSSTGARGR